MIHDKKPLKILKHRSKFPKLTIKKNRSGGENLYIDDERLPWSVRAYEITEYIGNAYASLTVTMDIDRDYTECSEEQSREPKIDYGRAITSGLRKGLAETPTIYAELDGLDTLKDQLELLNETVIDLISLAEDIKTTTVSVKTHVV